MPYQKPINGFFLYGNALLKKLKIPAGFKANTDLIEHFYEQLNKEQKNLWRERAKVIKYTTAGELYVSADRKLKRMPGGGDMELVAQRSEAMKLMLNMVSDLPL